ncbi:MAG: cob(I)yrinic acid a,c-diamide adenosyltransferase [Bacteroidales bacterium]
MKIYTKTGDNGTTALAYGGRRKKYDLRLESYGTVDELNSIFGILINSTIPASEKTFLQHSQHKLFEIGSILASVDIDKLPYRISDGDISEIESHIDNLDTDLAPLRNFVLPGSCISNAYCHLARTVCRRAERCVVELSDNEATDGNLIKYLNRMSDYLFTLSRTISKSENKEDIFWNSK